MMRGSIKVVLRISGKRSEKGITMNLRMNTLIIDRRMFVAGPAAAEIAMSLFGFLKFIGLIGTGFAYPKTNCPFVNIKSIRGMSIVPNKSK
jgi:hypothetical protein